MIPERWVLDTNVVISAVLSRSGAPASLIDQLAARRAVLVFSTETLAELESRIMRGKFDRIVGRETRRRFLAELDAVSERVQITGATMGCRDRDDDKVLETALSGAAEVIVSGDRDLLTLDPWQQIPILEPAEALSTYSPAASK